MDSIRQQKVGNLIKKDLSEIFQQGSAELALGSMVTVTHVKVSPDLSVARVYLSIFAAKDKQGTFDFIKSKGKEIRFQLGKRTGKQLRKIPELKFILDDTLDYASKVDQLLKD